MGISGSRWEIDSCILGEGLYEVAGVPGGFGRLKIGSCIIAHKGESQRVRYGHLASSPLIGRKEEFLIESTRVHKEYTNWSQRVC